MLDKSAPIMLVDDDRIDIMTMQRIFKEQDIKNPLYVAHNGKEAIDFLTGNNGQKKLNPLPKIILLDINMPKMNGIEFLAQLRSHVELKPIHVFILTTSDDKNDINAAHEFNVAGYLVKSIDTAEFSKKIAALKQYWSIIEMPK